MTLGRAAGPFALLMIAILALAPLASAASVAAGRTSGHGHGATTVRQHGGAGLHGGHPTGGSRPSATHPFGSRRPGRPAAVTSSWVYASPAVIYYGAPPPAYGGPTAYEPEPYYEPPMGYASPAFNDVSLAPAPVPAPPPPPMPRVVEYSTGRYELRGDGSVTPYSWVWIPNPPAPPPAPPSAPPAASQPSGVRLSKLYHWTDDEGVVHWTDRRDAVPERYLEEAKPPAR